MSTASVAICALTFLGLICAYSFGIVFISSKLF